MKEIKNCYICGSSSFIQRRGRVRDNDALRVLECVSCGLVFLSSHEHITQVFYENSGMVGGEANIDKRLRENEWDDKRRFTYLRSKLVNKRVLEFGAGVGGFAGYAQSIVENIEVVEIEKVTHHYYEKKGIKAFLNCDEVLSAYGKHRYDVICAFHVLEHLPDPRKLLMSFRELLVQDGEIVVEVPNANDALLMLYENDAFSQFTYWSCHLYLFNKTSLAKLAESAHLRVNFIKQIQRYPLSNHLYWLAKGMPGGHKKWFFIDHPQLHDAYEKQLAALGCCDTLIAGFSI